MATEDAKLKFLPRHLQITQPASAQKSKRRVTVEDENAGDEESDRRSVFDRLGPGGSQRNEAGNKMKQKPCFEFQEHGKCQFGKNCSYSHVVKEKSKSSREGNKSPDNLRLTFKGEKDKESKVRSQVVVRKTDGGNDDDSNNESDSSSIDNLQQKRQEIQRALIALDAGEESAVGPKKSESSDVSSPDRPHKKKKDKARKKDKKKHKKEIPEKEQSVEKSKDSKRRHESDHEDVQPRKKHKKKNKEKKHADDSAPPVVADPFGKQKKGLPVKGAKSGMELYDPDSPTPVTRDSRSLSSSPKAKSKGKKRKKKQTIKQVEVTGKSKKLLSPLKKVLKKKGSGSLDSSKRSRSVSQDTPQRKRNRSRSSSSSVSRSRSVTPVRKRKPVLDMSRDRGRKKSKSPERKKRVRRQSVSSSSSRSSSSSSSSEADRSRRRGKKITHTRGRSDSRTKKTHSPVILAVRNDIRTGKKKLETNTEIWGKNKDRDSELKKGVRHSADRGRDKLRDKKDDRDTRRRNLSLTGRIVKEPPPDLRDKRKGGRDLKDGKMLNKDMGRPEGRRENKEREKVDRVERRDDNREREGGRDGSLNKERDRERDRQGGSLDREREGRNRRIGGFTAAHGQQEGDRGGRFQRGGVDDERDRDRRNFDEGGTRFPPPNEGQRMGQFQGDRGRQRGGFVRGAGRGGDNQVRGVRDDREWDERGGRRDGGDGFTEDWEGGRENRGGFGGYRDEGGREFGVPRDDRRVGAGRGGRLLPHLGGWNDAAVVKPLMGLDSRDRTQRGQGFRDDYVNRDNNERRDWKQREGSQESATQKSSRETDVGQGGREQSGGDGKLKGAARPTSEVSSKERLSARDSRGKVADKCDSAIMKVRRTESGKEESPVARDEPSLATLFSQTETAPIKKKPTKSFGGKKSPKKSADDSKAAEKMKPGLLGRMPARERIADRKDPMTSAGDSAIEKDVERDGGKIGAKKSDTKEKSRSLSPRGSQKSVDSRCSLSKSSRRSSKSPDSRRTSVRPSAARFALDGLRSPHKLSRSPAPSSSRERGRGLLETPRMFERGVKRERSRTHSRSGSESRHSSHSEGQEDKRRRLSSDSESLPAKLDGGDIAAAMLGDSIDDGQQDVFSEWSDDDEAYTILIDGKSRKNQVEDLDNHENDDFTPSPRSRYSPGMGRYMDPRDMRLEQDSRMNMDSAIEKPVFDKNIPNVKIVEDIQKEKPAREKGRRKPDDEGYEEISSDENDLDEEGEKVSKRTIVSILAIDMASLVASAKPKAVQGPVFQRYKAVSLFSEMGLSLTYAGEKLYKVVQDVCRKQLEAVAGPGLAEETKEDMGNNCSDTSCTNENINSSAAETEIKLKLEVDASSSPATNSGQVDASAIKDDSTMSDKAAALSPKKSPPKRTLDPSKLIRATLTSSAKPSFRLFGETSAYHKLNKAKAQERSGLLAQFGMFRRALTARKDLEIRRQLCGINPKHDQSAVYPSGSIDPETFRQCVQLFKQRRPSILADNKESCVA